MEVIGDDVVDCEAAGGVGRGWRGGVTSGEGTMLIHQRKGRRKEGAGKEGWVGWPPRTCHPHLFLFSMS